MCAQANPKFDDPAWEPLWSALEETGIILSWHITVFGVKPSDRAAGKAAAVRPRPAPIIYPDGLSEREVQVLRLIAAGRMNREIGAQLFISVNTVDRHVSHIFAKAGVANCAEAAAYALRRGLVH